jgi:N-formylglutamate deformylase
MADQSPEPLPDPVLAELFAEPYRITQPREPRAPFVFASPHSGRLYPASFVERSRLNPTHLRRSEDAFVDELFAAAAACGAPFLTARFPRAYLDANRAPAELDQAMFEDPLPFAVDRASPRVHAGLGVIPRIVRDGVEIYRDKLAASEAEERIRCLYRPYHSALARLVEETSMRFGTAVVVDCHSMPSGAAAPDIVLGDRCGLSAVALVTFAAERAFQRQGFSVARNTPYAGGYTTQLHGRPRSGVHALQIEINRGLYLDEERIARGARFVEIRQRIALALKELIAIPVSQPAPVAHAAE